MFLFGLTLITFKTAFCVVCIDFYTSTENNLIDIKCILMKLEKKEFLFIQYHSSLLQSSSHTDQRNKKQSSYLIKCKQSPVTYYENKNINDTYDTLVSITPYEQSHCSGQE